MVDLWLARPTIKLAAGPTMESLRLTSLQAPNQNFIGRLLGGYLSTRLDLPVAVVEDLPWLERQRQLDRGAIQVGWICGLTYVDNTDRAHPSLELLAAPVMSDPRYQDQPLYYSDVVVRAESRWRSFDDLRGVTWAYNEPHSHSGYNITRYHLASQDERGPFFGRIVEAGSHENALAMLLAGQVDAAAIDSTVLDIERRRQPDLNARLRVIQALGPSPSPPWVVSRSVPLELVKAIRQTLLNMNADPLGQKLLAKARMARFAMVSDADYEPLRLMAKVADTLEPW
jgi:phosphonate transport system substrate-binding protein